MSRNANLGGVFFTQYSDVKWKSYTGVKWRLVPLYDRRTYLI